jgi:hypothetical protein
MPKSYYLKAPTRFFKTTTESVAKDRYFSGLYYGTIYLRNS